METITTIEQFSFDKGGYFATKFRIELHGNKAVYSAGMITDSEKICKKTIPEHQIGKFLSALNQLKVTRWKPEYMNESVDDGEQWELQIRYNRSEKKKVYGSNARPGKFKGLLNAIRELIQEPTFFEEEFLKPATD